MTKQGGCFERSNFIMTNRNRKSYSGCRFVKSRNWLVVQDLVTGAGQDCWCETGSRWMSGLVVAGAGLVAAAAGRWSLVLGGSCWCCRSIVAAAGRCLLVQDS